ncbi:alpha/beta hydrolase [Nocardia acidivorans]|uniref:alpha/beta hydrolase n=1 Tax=Nocardia acidivorans TaxID=404580 RepID=UPI000A01A8DB|nr:alpha/beta hydrolase-fold protein [Nocardia acidivorans]
MSSTIAVVPFTVALPQSPPLAPPPAPRAPAGSGHQGGFQHGLSLLHGWVPQVALFLAVFFLVLAVARFTRRWWLLWVPACVTLAAGVTWVAWAYMNDEGLASDPAPVLLWVAVGMTALAVGLVLVGWQDGAWWQRVAAVLAVPLALVNALIVLDQWVGYYPTVRSAWAAATAESLPHQTSLASLAGMRNGDVGSGRIVPVDIPESGSHFKHRREYVYLPPAWFAGDKPPALPVVMMIGGEFNTPADWVRSGQIMPAVDDFVNGNGGQAPVLVFVDSGGSFNNDTECVNGTRGDAADHLTNDVPHYMKSAFGVSADPARWAAVGWSMGGTCAVDLAVMHPELLHTFLDIAGDLGPTAGTKEQTVRRLYGGDAAAWARFDPRTVMAAHGPYQDMVGVYDDLTPPQRQGGPGADHGNIRPKQPAAEDDSVGLGGRDGVFDTGELGAANTLCEDGRRVGIDCTVNTTRGGHTWQFASSAFTSTLPWLTARLGLPAPNRS